LDYYELNLLDDATKDRAWMQGEKFDIPPNQPISLQAIDAEYSLFPPVYSHPLPLMRRDVAAIFDKCGVSNLDFYTTTVAVPSGLAVPEYLAYNIVGKIAAADMGQSTITPSFGDLLMSAQVHKLVIDPAKTRGALMFRLAESLDGIVVHETIKTAVETAGIVGLGFIPPEKWSSF
jgi:hypothetical protein